MTHIQFQAPEYQADGSFSDARYEYEGDEQKGWVLKRNGAEFDRLGPGYTPVESMYCGVCSTDLARRFLPYPLPQVIGHEVVGTKAGQPVVVEINASHQARGIADSNDPYNSIMHPHDPRRITLGIDRLPGGFAPVMLAPVNAVIPVPESVSPLVASLTEPFAAALQGVESTHPRPGDRVAVLGPRRLGSLIIAALAGFRKQSGIDFEIIAVARHQHLLDLCMELGADSGLNLAEEDAAQHRQAFDIVYDTTGKPEGFAVALELTRRVLHLKSTNGQEVMGLKHLTDMVVDEIALIPAAAEHMDYTWPVESKAGETRANHNVFVAPAVSAGDLSALESGEAEAAGDKKSANGRRFHRATVDDVVQSLEASGETDRGNPEGKLSAADKRPEFFQGSPFARFDLAVASNLNEVDAIVRPHPGEEFSILRARGAVLLTKSQNGRYDSPLHEAVAERGIEIHTSRCGNFERALEILAANPDIASALEKNLITHRYRLEDIREAFDTAADSKASVKVIVETSAN
ncbi:MAG: threonine dehydrogenase [bacterium]|nr:threonine dehydrogenase [bacterium]